MKIIFHMRFIILFIIVILASCTQNKVTSNHGVLSLEKKYNEIFIKKTNKNDILDILGPPSTDSTFNNNIWIYVERKKTNQSIIKLGNKKIEKNNVLVLELDERGILVKKELYDLNKMNKLDFSKNTTEKSYSKNTFMYNLLTSLREKINAPRRKKLEK